MVCVVYGLDLTVCAYLRQHDLRQYLNVYIPLNSKTKAQIKKSSRMEPPLQ